MPIYEFQCGDCGEHFDVYASFREKDKGLNPKCPRCGSENVKQVVGSQVFIARSKEATFPSTRGG